MRVSNIHVMNVTIKLDFKEILKYINNQYMMVSIIHVMNVTIKLDFKEVLKYINNQSMRKNLSVMYVEIYSKVLGH